MCVKALKLLINNEFCYKNKETKQIYLWGLDLLRSPLTNKNVDEA